MIRHIITWAKDEQNRLNPHNGLCLNSIHDRAFDKGFITVTADCKIQISKILANNKEDDAVSNLFIKFENQSIILAGKFSPSKEILEYHHQNIFIK